MGATGTGKSRLSIDLATNFSPSEIINSDKMQIYQGLSITTNKIPVHERSNIPHHLLDEFDSYEHELTPFDYRSLADSTVAEIFSRNCLPVLVGGSNSLIYSFLTKELSSSDSLSLSSSSLDFFCSSAEEDGVSGKLRYDCCFLWIDVALPVLKEYLSLRVDQMIDSGMFEELSKFYECQEEEDEEETTPVCRTGIRKSIGVPEFERFFKLFPPGKNNYWNHYYTNGNVLGTNGCIETNGGTVVSSVVKSIRDGCFECGGGGDGERRREMRMVFEEAVEAVKCNTYELAIRQIKKIERLRLIGWNIQKLDATEVFRAVLESDSGKSSEIWDKEIVEKSVKIVKQFLDE
ncbi:adenylate isopentenyltransferase-like [Papaver somniferum]|uniref:adenylate isopentenyltransferase-like n=1 Tax=Papaver somniferum TaxID=3469 RepID=UPI000E6FC4D7|nr:adenylate isopentenyltransferase-like [Papaver somniferum]